jgi:predicted TIM-barrel fold metal-dependent hydrolase
MIIDVHLHVGYEKEYIKGDEEKKRWWKYMFTPFEKPYNYSTDNTFEQTVEGHIEKMDKLGIEKSYLIGIDAETAVGFKIDMDAMADMVKKHPDRFIGVPGIDPMKGIRKAVDDIQKAKDLGHRGVKFFPCFGWDPTDMQYDPLYKKLYDLSMFFVMHVGSQIMPHTRLKYCSPLMIDEVAYRFPELRIIETHIGWPWMGEALIVARKNKNVYCDFSGLIPSIHIGDLSHTANIGTYRLAEIQLPDKLLFGSDAPHGSQEDIIEMVHNLPVAEEVKKKWLGENAIQFLNLEY